MTASIGVQSFSFGSGYLYGIPLNAAATQQSPVRLGVLQECSYDISSTTKEVYGQNQFAAAIGRGAAKFTGKAKMGQFSSIAWNNFFFGPGSDGSAYPTNGTSAIVTVNNETGTVATHAYTAAALTTPGGTFDTDLGAYYTSGVPLTKVTTLTAAGQYTVSNAGVYTLFSSDSATQLIVNYTYSPTAATQVIQAINNNAFPMGAAPVFEIVHSIPYGTGGTNATFKIYSAISNKLAFGFKNNDFTMPEIDFQMFANAAGKVLDIITAG